MVVTAGDEEVEDLQDARAGRVGRGSVLGQGTRKVRCHVCPLTITGMDGECVSTHTAFLLLYNSLIQRETTQTVSKPVPITSCSHVGKYVNQACEHIHLQIQTFQLYGTLGRQIKRMLQQLIFTSAGQELQLSNGSILSLPQ